MVRNLLELSRDRILSRSSEIFLSWPGSEGSFGAGLYDQLDREWAVAFEKLRGGDAPSGAEPVAQVIADAVEGIEDKLRWPVGTDADMVLAARTTMDDETFEATMRGVLELTW